MISIFINGENRQLDGPLTCTALIKQLELTGKRIAIECNGSIVTRSSFDQQTLNEGDRIEIVVAVGGG